MSDARILSVLARQIIDCSAARWSSRCLYDGRQAGRGSSPTGSVGRHVVVRDGALSGMSVRKAVAP